MKFSNSTCILSVWQVGGCFVCNTLSLPKLLLLLCDKTMYMTCNESTVLVRILYCQDRTTTQPHIRMHICTYYSTNMCYGVIANLLYTRIQYMCMHNTCKWNRKKLHVLHVTTACTVQCIQVLEFTGYDYMHTHLITEICKPQSDTPEG